MRIVFFLVLLLGIGIAGFAGFLVLQEFQSKNNRIVQLQNELGEKVELKKVAVAAKDLTYGQRLSPEEIEMVDFPVNALPENAFLTTEDLFGAEDADKPLRTVLRSIDKGEIVSERKVTGFGQDAGVASRLQRGMRAFTLEVDVASGVSGFLRPGDNVDIYWTGDIDRETVSRLILDGVNLIAIDQLSDSERNRPIVARTVTVAVSPQVVAALAQAQATGKLQLSLRGIGDDTSSGTIEVNQNDLLGRQEVQEVTKKECTIKSRKGGEIVVTVIPCPN